MTGSKLLWRQLSHRGVVESVDINASRYKVKKWPGFLKELPTIKNLSINSLSEEWWSELGVRVDMMPRQLRRLKLKGLGYYYAPGDLGECKVGNEVGEEKVDEEKVGEENVGEEKVDEEKVDEEKVGEEKVDEEKVGEEKANEKKKEKEEGANVFFAKFGVPFHLADLMPHLEDLELDGGDMWDYSWMRYCPATLTKLRIPRWDAQMPLPSSLRHFRTYSVHLPSDLKDVKLPGGLETLVVYSSFGWDVLLPLLPPSLLRLSIIDSIPLSDFSLSKLPSSLTHLTLPRKPSHLGPPPHLSPPSSFSPPDPSPSLLLASPQLVSLLPRTLTTLENVDLPSATWPFLPPSLTKLSCFDTLSSMIAATTLVHPKTLKPVQLKTWPFHTLPNAITQLSLTCLELVYCGTPTSLQATPTNVTPTKMSTTQVTTSQMTPNQMTPNQTTPNQTTPNQTTPTQMSFLPPTLTSLSLSNIFSSPDVAKLLPSSLTSLTLYNICKRVCKHLPATLTQLTVFNAMMSPKLIHLLPKSLLNLSLRCIDSRVRWFRWDTGRIVKDIGKLAEYSLHQKYGSNLDGTLPPKLTYLKFSHFNDLGDVFLMSQKLGRLLHLDLADSQCVTDLSIPLLSPHLTSLDLSSSSKLSGQHFPSLPKNLTFLSFRASSSIFDNDIQHLPRTLRTIFLDSAIHLSDLCAPHFPQHLSTLILSKNRKITPNAIPQFPYPLTSDQYQGCIRLERWSISSGQIR